MHPCRSAPISGNGSSTFTTKIGVGFPTTATCYRGSWCTATFNHARSFVRLLSGFATDRAGGPRPTDEVLLDLHQAFVDLSVEIPSVGQFTLRSGRQEVDTLCRATLA